MTTEATQPVTRQPQVLLYAIDPPISEERWEELMEGVMENDGGGTAMPVPKRAPTRDDPWPYVLVPVGHEARWQDRLAQHGYTLALVNPMPEEIEQSYQGLLTVIIDEDNEDEEGAA